MKIHKLSEELFLGRWLKRYTSDEPIDVPCLIDMLEKKNIHTKYVHISEEHDVGCALFEGTYDLEGFYQTYYGIVSRHRSAVDGYMLTIENDDIDNIYTYEDDYVGVTTKNPDFELNEVLEDLLQ